MSTAAKVLSPFSISAVFEDIIALERPHLEHGNVGLYGTRS